MNIRAGGAAKKSWGSRQPALGHDRPAEENKAKNGKQAGCAIMNSLQREAGCEGVAEEYSGMFAASIPAVEPATIANRLK